MLILFGNYRGTTRQVGLFWANPFYANGPAGRRRSGRESGGTRLPRYKISLRARTLNGEKLKVNDKRRQPGGDRRQSSSGT